MYRQILKISLITVVLHQAHEMNTYKTKRARVSVRQFSFFETNVNISTEICYFGLHQKFLDHFCFDCCWSNITGLKS
jgi:hypothetical protein